MVGLDFLTIQAQPTNAFFATVNQMFGGSSQLSTSAERAVIKSLSTDNEAALGSGHKLEGAVEHLIDGSENAFVGWPLNCPHVIEKRSKS